MIGRYIVTRKQTQGGASPRKGKKMKRMVNDVPLGSILGLIGGNTKIIVEERKECLVYYDKAEAIERWTGFAKNFYNDEIHRYKWNRTKVREIRHLPDAIMFIISTQFEQS